MGEVAVVDASGIAVAGSSILFRNVIQQDGSVLDLGGKTVIGTFRQVSDPRGTIDAALEDHAVVIPGDGSGGTVELTLGTANSDLLSTPIDPVDLEPYYLQYVVTDDDYAPQVLRFNARRGLGI